MPLEDIAVSRQPVKEAPQSSLQQFKEAIASQASRMNLPGGFNLGKLPSFKGKKGSKEEEEMPPRGEGVPPRRGRDDMPPRREAMPPRREDMPPRRGRGRDDEDMPPRREDMPPRRGREEVPPRRGREEVPPRGGRGREDMPPRRGEGVSPEAAPAPTDAKPKGMFGGLFAKMGFGKGAEKKPAEPVPPQAKEENRYDARGRNRYDDEEYDMPPRRRYDDEEEYDTRGRNRYDDEEYDMPPRRHFEEEEESFSEDELPRRPRKAKKAKKAKQLEALSSGEEIPSEPEPEPEEPEGKPQPFHRGKRIPYIPPLVKSTNPFARSCGNPFALVSTSPPKPTAPPAPGAAYDAYLPQKEKVRPEPRPGFNPFAAKKKGSLAVMTDWRNLPTPQPGFNPFQGERPRTIVINGKARTNPFA